MQNITSNTPYNIALISLRGGNVSTNPEKQVETFPLVLIILPIICFVNTFQKKIYKKHFTAAKITRTVVSSLRPSAEENPWAGRPITSADISAAERILRKR